MYLGVHYCRGIAALLVVLYHAGVTLEKEKYFGESARYIHDVFYFGGDAGVAFFFVLSGYLINVIHREDDRGWSALRAYFVKRLTRIYPVYWVVFCGALVLTAIFPIDAKYSGIQLLKAFLLVPQDKMEVGGTGSPIVAVAWTLQYEVLFYLFYGLSYISRRLAVFLAVAIAFGSVSALFFSFGFPGNILLSHYCLLFCAGVFCSELAPCLRSIVRPMLLIILGVIGFIALGYMAEPGVSYSRSVYSLGYGVFGSLLLIVLFSEPTTRRREGLFSFFHALGDSSYALYLTHFFILSLGARVLSRLIPHSEFGAGLSFACCVLVSLAFGFLFHRLVERPLIRHVKSFSGALLKRELGRVG